MRTAFEEEEDLASQSSQQDREFTLSSTTILVIFFGLVLICGLFFGLGYTLGRRAPSEANQDAVSPRTTPEVSPAALQTFDSRPKPSAASQTEVPAPTPQEPQAVDTGSTTPSETKPETNTPESPAAPPAQASTTPAPGTASIMVQIAAVSNPADADVLVGALHKHGYSATVRRDPADSLIHVQVGPFSTRTDAIAMRQKLLGDGYNAILK